MEKNITIKSTKGLHAQLANKLVQVTNKLDVAIYMQYDNVKIDS